MDFAEWLTEPSSSSTGQPPAKRQKGANVADGHEGPLKKNDAEAGGSKQQAEAAAKSIPAKQKVARPRAYFEDDRLVTEPPVSQRILPKDFMDRPDSASFEAAFAEFEPLTSRIQIARPGPFNHAAEEVDIEDAMRRFKNISEGLFVMGSVETASALHAALQDIVALAQGYADIKTHHQADIQSMMGTLGQALKIIETLESDKTDLINILTRTVIERDRAAKSLEDSRKRRRAAVHEASDERSKTLTAVRKAQDITADYNAAQSMVSRLSKEVGTLTTRVEMQDQLIADIQAILASNDESS